MTSPDAPFLLAWTSPPKRVTIAPFDERLPAPVTLVRRRPDLRQRLDRPAVPVLSRLPESPPVGSRLALGHVGHLADPDIAVIELGVPRYGQGGDHAPPRVPGQDQPFLAELRQEVQGQLPGVGDELVDVHPVGVPDGAVGFSGAALVPVHDREVLLEMARVPPVRRQLGRPGAAVQEQDDRVGDVLRPLQNPLIAVPDADPFQGGEAGPAPDPGCSRGEDGPDGHQAAEAGRHGEGAGLPLLAATILSSHGLTVSARPAAGKGRSAPIRMALVLGYEFGQRREAGLCSGGVLLVGIPANSPARSDRNVAAIGAGDPAFAADDAARLPGAYHRRRAPRSPARAPPLPIVRAEWSAR